MKTQSTRRCPTTTVALALAACTALGSGAAGLALLARYSPTPHQRTGPMLLAPMIGIVDTCITLPESSEDITQTCTGPNGSAAALIESTLSALQPKGKAQGEQGTYPLGYTLPVPLLQLFKETPQGWAIDSERVQRFARTVRDTQRPLILYLFSTHFSTDAPIEKALASDSANLAQTRDGPIPTSHYYGAPIYNWTLARTDNSLTQRRAEATQALLKALCQLPPSDIAKIKGVTLLGESHQLFPDFERDMGFGGVYRVSDYSPASVVGFRQFLRQEFQQIERLNRILGTDYADFEQVQPPSRDIRTEPLQRYAEHIDSFAHGSLPVSGWAFVPQAEGAAPAWVHIYRNGVFVGKTPVNQGRQDVLQSKPAFGTANTGWRWDMDFKNLPTGQHQLDIFLEQKPGTLTHLGTRHINLMNKQQRPPHALPQKALPAHIPANSLNGDLQASIDWPAEQSSYYYNPLVALWHRFRGQQVVDYLRFFQGVVADSCLAPTPHYTHQIIPFTNPSWDAQKFAIQASLQPSEKLRLGVSLYGNATYGSGFGRWYARTGQRSYGVTEFHPLKAMDAHAVGQMLGQHAARGAAFLSFFLEPRWQGALLARTHNMFSFDPDNTQFGSAALYPAVQKTILLK